MIECNEINEIFNEVLVAFADGNQPTNADHRKMMNVMRAMVECSNTEGDYDSLITNVYDKAQEVIIPANTLHSYTLCVMEGAIMYAGLKFTKGSVKNVEFSTMNTSEIRFEVLKGAKVLFEYMTLADMEIND